MEFKFRAMDKQVSTDHHPHPLSSISYLTPQLPQHLRVGHESITNGSINELFHSPSNVREAIQREIEKERIKEEIIAEMARKRMLEAEARREVLIEREMMLRRTDKFSILSMANGSPDMRIEPRPSILNQSLEGTSGFSARREIVGFKTLQFQHNVEPRISNVKPLSEVSKDKGISVAKPDWILSGVKRKAVTPPPSVASELPSINSKKKTKDEWSCAICKVSATSELTLNEHLRGKKHQNKEAAFRASGEGKNFSIGLFPKEIGKTTDNQRSEQGEKMGGESHVKSNAEDKKIDEQPMHGMRVLDNLDKSKGEKTQNLGIAGEEKKKKRYIWCKMCKIRVCSEKVMETHLKGKKHVARLREFNQNGGSASEVQMEGYDEMAKDEEVVAENENKQSFEDVDQVAARDTNWVIID